MVSQEKQKPKLLFVDDEQPILDSFVYSFHKKYQIFTAKSGNEALDIYSQHPDIALILSDQRMPGMSGVELLSRLHMINPDSIRIIVTGYTEFNDIMDAINRGHIFQYILKPWEEPQMKLAIERGVNLWQLTAENKKLWQDQKIINAQLNKANKRLHHLSLNLMQAQEEERKRIAMELHDDIGQSLIALKLQCRNIEYLTQKGNPQELATTLLTVRKTLQEAITNTRNLSQNLNSTIIDEFGIDHALEDFISRFSMDYKIETKCDLLKIKNMFSEREQHQLYRILQEIFNNIGKHSGTNQLRLNMCRKGKYLKIIIVDHGCGFNINEIESRNIWKRGIGLAIISERMTLLGGKFEIKSTPNQGSEFTLSVPIKQEQ